MTIVTAEVGKVGTQAFFIILKII